MAVEARESCHPDEGALQLTDVGLDARGDELQHIWSDGEPFSLDLALQDGYPGLQVGRLDVGEQTPLEATAQPWFQGLQQFRGPVGGHDDLLLRIVQGVEGVEELLLGLDLGLQELDVVDQQDVDVAICPSELCSAIGADGVDEVVGELLGGDVLHPYVVVIAEHVGADGVQQMRLAEPRTAIDEQRVVRLSGRLRHGHGGGMGEPVRRSDDEGVEGVLGVEVRSRVVGLLGAISGIRGQDGRRGHPRPWDELGDRQLLLVILRTIRGTQGQLQIGIDGDGQVNGAVEGVGEQLLQLGTHLRLDVVASELIGYGNHRRRGVHRHRGRIAQPGTVGLGDVVQQ